MKKIRNKKIKICFIGRVAINHSLFDGQTIKTKLLYENLIKNPNFSTKLVDTFYKKRKIRMFFKSVFALLNCKNVIFSLSTNGLNTYLRIFKIFQKFKKLNIYHYVIGGGFHKYLENNPKFIPVVQKFKVNWVESNRLVNQLKKMNINNGQYMPNFKPLRPVELKDVVQYTKPVFKFVIFSRIIKEKGISIASECIQKINKDYNQHICDLDLYGDIGDEYKEDFEQILRTNEFIHYKGIVKPFESVDVLKKYYMLLFPTFWPTEGFAGTLLDAFFAGLPVIASDWNCNSEIVKDGISGFLYPNDSFKNLYDCVKYAIENHDKINKMKAECIAYAKEFEPDKYIKEIEEFITNNK